MSLQIKLIGRPAVFAAHRQFDVMPLGSLALAQLHAPTKSGLAIQGRLRASLSLEGTGARFTLSAFSLARSQSSAAGECGLAHDRIPATVE